MFENVRVTAFTVSELLGENQHGGGGGGAGVKITSPSFTQIRVKRTIFVIYALFRPNEFRRFL